MPSQPDQKKSPQALFAMLSKPDHPRMRALVFVALCALFFLTPMLDEVLQIKLDLIRSNADFVVLLAVLLFTFFLFVTVVAVVATRRRDLITAIALGIPFVIMSIINSFELEAMGGAHGDLVVGAFFAPFGLHAGYCLLKFIFTSRGSVEDRLFACASAYLLIGASFGGVYCMIELWQPDSFVDVTGKAPDFETLRYFSFVTMSTLGYGDITPRGDLARAVATGEAITGVFLLAFIVSRIFAFGAVGGMASSKSPEANEEQERTPDA